jgi:hypothetical protein
MKKIIVVFLLGGLAGCASSPSNPGHSATEPAPNAGEILREIERDGAARSIDRIWNDNRSWAAAMSAIRSGSTDGLAIYRALRPNSDAGMTEDLEAAIAEAVTPNPEGALVTFQEVSRPDYLDCGRTSLSDLEEEPSRAQAKEALTQLTARSQALSSLPKSSKIHSETKTACRESLEKARRFWTKKLAR